MRLLLRVFGLVLAVWFAALALLHAAAALGLSTAGTAFDYTDAMWMKAVLFVVLMRWVLNEASRP